MFQVFVNISDNQRSKGRQIGILKRERALMNLNRMSGKGVSDLEKFESVPEENERLRHKENQGIDKGSNKCKYPQTGTYLML